MVEPSKTDHDRRAAEEVRVMTAVVPARRGAAPLEEVRASFRRALNLRIEPRRRPIFGESSE